MKKIILTISILCISAAAVLAQQQPQGPLTPEEKEKKMSEYIDKEIERLSSSLKLEYWQEFYADSTMRNNLQCMQDELDKLQKSAVQNYDVYIAVQDKWDEKTYESFHKFLTAEQWEKYLKMGAQHDKNQRDKRAGLPVEKSKPKKERKGRK